MNAPQAVESGQEETTTSQPPIGGLPSIATGVGTRAIPRATGQKVRISLGHANGDLLRIKANELKGGKAVTYVVCTRQTADGHREDERGATERHASMEDARNTVAKLVIEATKVGWVRARGSGAKADAFDALHLPVPEKKP